LDNTSQPSALAFAPYGNVLFLTLQGTDRIVALDPKTRLVLAKGETGAAPQGIAVDADSGRLFVQDFLGRTVGVYDAANILRNGADTLLRRAAVPVSAREPLPTTVLAGKRIFYGAADSRMSQDGYTSCAACHLDGAQDGQVWDFTDRGEGLRNTTTLLGKSGMGHGPLHWSANFDEMQDFEHDMRGPFGGKGFLTEVLFRQGTRSSPLGDPKAGHSPDLDALAAFVASLTSIRRSPFRTPEGSFTAEARAGEAIFRRSDLGCAACHVPPSFTDSRLPGSTRPAPGAVTVFAGAASRYTAEGFLLHDVGTLKASSGRRLNQEQLPGLDTPTLLGLWETAPYLHDGSATNLLDVLTTANPGDKHGRTSHLTAQEREQLVAFLLQLDATDAGPDAAMPRLPGPFSPSLSEVRSAGGRLLGFRLAGSRSAPPPSLGLHDLHGRRVGTFPAGAWRSPGGASTRDEWYLPWSAMKGSSADGKPGIFLVQPLGREKLRPLKILIGP
jgi:large repetitive protein